MSLKVRSEPRIIQTFAKTKMKYLVPIRMKLSLVASEEGNIFGVARFLTQNFSLLNNEEQIVHILTDNELIVQNFTPNAAKLLCLDSSSINNNLDITDFIKEFTEELYKEIEQYEDIKENAVKIMKKIKADLLKKMFSHADSRRIITWRFNEMLKNNENSGNNNYKNVWSFKAIKKNFGKQSKIGNINQSALNDNFGRAFKLNNSREGSKGIRSEVDNRFNPSEISKKSKRASVPYEGEKQFGVNELNEKINEINMDVPNMSSANNVSSKNNNILPFGQSLFHKFVLSVTDVKFGETKIGHIFRFEVFDPSKTYSDISNIGTKVSTKFGLTKPPTIKDKTELMSSDISLMSFSPNMAKPAAPQVLFNVTNENPNGINLGLDNTFIPVLDPENEFYIDGDKLSFKQRGKNEDFKKEIEREKLRQKAQDKILKAKISKDDEEEEEEEESSSYEEDDNESKENSEKISIKENNENKSYFSDKEGPLSIDKITPIQEKSEKENKIVEHQTHKTEVKAHAKHNKEDDFYQVDTSKIIFKVYNFTSGYVTEVKDPKFKISKVTHCLNKERKIE